MARASPRFTVILCVLLLLQEFGHARFVRGPLNNIVFKDEAKQEDEVDGEDEEAAEENDVEAEDKKELKHRKSDHRILSHLKPQKSREDYSGSRKSWISAIFKAVSIGGDVANMVVSAVAVSAAIYQAIHGCCGELQEPKLCEYERDFKKVQKEVEDLSDEADNLQARAENEQLWVGSDLDEYESIVGKLKQIDDQQEILLEAIHPSVKTAINNATHDIKILMKAKNATAEGVLYDEIEGVYNSAMTNVINIGSALLGLAIPVGTNLNKLVKKRQRTRKIMDISTAENVELKVSTDSGPTVKKTKVGKFIGDFKVRIETMKSKLNTRFSKAAKYANAFKAGLAVGLNYASAGFQVFQLIKGAKECRRIKEDAFDALNKVKLAKTTIGDQIENITEHLGIMNEAWQYLRGNITDQTFLDSLESVKEMVADLSERSDDMSDVAEGIQNFVDSIETSTSYNATYDLSSQLASDLSKVPFTVSCYSSKYGIVNRIVANCRVGAHYKTFDDWYDEEQNNFVPGSSFDPNNPNNCEDKVGFKYIKKEDVKAAWVEVARNESLNENCIWNKRELLTLLCAYKNEGYTAEDIVGKLANIVVVTLEQVQEIMVSCPMTDENKQVVCWERDHGKTDKDIAKENSWPEDKVAEVTCPWPLTEPQKRKVCDLRDIVGNETVATVFLKVDVSLVEAVACPRPSRDASRAKPKHHKNDHSNYHKNVHKNVHTKRTYRRRGRH